MSVTTVNDFVKDLEPLTGVWVDQGAKRYGEEYARVMKVVDKDVAYYEDMMVSGLGMLQVKPEGEAVRYDKMSQRWYKRYTPTGYALGVQITHEAIRDGTALDKAQMAITELGRSSAELKNTLAHDIYNNAFTSTDGGDGKELCATDHPTDVGVTSNELATPAAFSTASLKQVYIEMKAMTDLTGNRLKIMPRKILLPRELIFEADDVFKSINEPDNADNTVNSLRSSGIFNGEIIISDWLSSSTAYFILTDEDQNGVQFFEREKLITMRDKDTDTFNAKIIVYTSFGLGWTNYNGVFGSAGA